jgi:hypothetical protein
MGAWGTDCRPVLIWVVSKRFAHACITLSPTARAHGLTVVVKPIKIPTTPYTPRQTDPL